MSAKAAILEKRVKAAVRKGEAATQALLSELQQCGEQGEQAFERACDMVLEEYDRMEEHF